jgi:uncharacterized protein YodC (DUF2158 family)
MRLNQHSLKASNTREPPLNLGDFVRLNSGGPTMRVADYGEDIVIVDWPDHSGNVLEQSYPVTCVHRVSHASAGSA